MRYHDPVLLNEAIEGLQIQEAGNYVDVTFGGGGHSRAILDRLTAGRLIAFDRDADAEQNHWEQENFQLVRQNFRFLRNYLKLYNALPIHGLLADLGVSSHQFDEPERGFSFRSDVELDMRMDRDESKSARHVVAEYTPEALAQVLRQYGEVPRSFRVAEQLVRARAEKEVRSTGDLVQALEPVAPMKQRSQWLAQVFQALRIEVNDELGALKGLLKQAVECLVSGGRLVVISYHSLEDRLVKNFFRAGNFEGEPEKDLYGNILRPLDPVNRKVIVPTAEEIERNPRARSAKMRIAVKR